MLSTSHVQTAMSRFMGKLFRSSDDDFTEYPTDCYACTQVGVPVFHSTTCDPVQKPEWEASAGSSLVPIATRSSRNSAAARNRRLIVDPRSTNVQRWNRLIVLARGVALATDPLYFLSMSVSGGGGGRPCIYMDGGVATLATVVRTCVDLVHMCHLLVRFRLAYVSRESLVVGCGKLVRDPRAIASHYLLSANGFWFDVFVVLPIPQATYWLLVPVLLRENRIEEMTIVLQLTFLVQFLPKVYHCYCLMRGMRKVTGYIFGSIWWGFCLNLIAYFLASNVFLHAVMMRRRKMQLRYRDMEWWMKHRQLPSQLRQRVRKYEHQIWEMMGGQDEMELIKDLPSGLRRDIKRYICLDLIKKVPLFHNLDDLVLDNICDRIKPLLYSKDEKVQKPFYGSAVLIFYLAVLQTKFLLCLECLKKTRISYVKRVVIEDPD
ncbi:Cyclic nucleotide-gated ion channel 2 [Sesamum angolense]|uniref:Cyclic nucleotide-gated ion channel 2 n=1 Tax=Sesamum angolense TaxID=2727404 RepID=A0AAE2C5J6_9LAMI|nr:Cyclic nucleotide-gated ion channel 2 [Sesamum angolense]